MSDGLYAGDGPCQEPRSTQSYSGTCEISARRSAAVACKIAPCCLRVTSSLRRFVHGPRPIHERSKAALCAATAPPRRRFGSRVRETRSCKSCAFAPNVVLDPWGHIQLSSGERSTEICVVFAIASSKLPFNEVPSDARRAPLKSLNRSPGHPPSQPRHRRQSPKNEISY